MVANPAEKFQALSGKSREEAAFFYSGGPFKVAERTWFVTNVGGVTAFETDEGLVLVDAGMRLFSPQMAKDIRQYTPAPVHTVIYTHHHIDHAFGTADFLAEGQPRPRVIAHRAMPANFARYERTLQHTLALNARHGGNIPENTNTVMGAVDQIFLTGKPDLLPDTLFDDCLTIEVGHVTFELHHSRGETDDHTWVYCPQRDVLCCGEFIIWAVPNAGNPQKVQRYPWDWSDTLREMAALKPATLCPGHGSALIGEPELIQQILLETAGYLDSIVEQTLNAMEKGSPPHVDIVRSVKPPTTDSPWLQPIYDEAEFISRNVVRFYGGWYTGRPSELKPAPREAVAAEIAKLAGGAAALADRATSIAQTGDIRLACHLADYALEAAPEDGHVKEIVARVYEQRATSETSFMAVNLFRTAAAYANAGRPFT